MATRITTPSAETPQAIDPVATAARLGAVREEAAVGVLIEQKTRHFEELSALKLWYRVYESVVEGDNDDRLFLGARPIVAVTSVSIGDDDPLTEGPEDDDFDVWNEDGYLLRENNWESGGARWRIDYTAGWWLPSMPDGEFAASGALRLAVDRPDVELAIYEMVVLQWQIDKRDRTVKSGSVAGFGAVQYGIDQWMPKTAHQTVVQLRPLVV